MRTRSIALISSALFVVALGGCNSAKPSDDPKSGVPSPSKKAEGLGASPAPDGTKPAETTLPNPAPDRPAISLDKIPTSLKNDAYEYYGLANTNPQDFEIISVGDPESMGTQTTKLVEMKGDRAIFRVTRTGSLASLGENDLSLRPDGVWSENSTLDPSMKPSVEIPTDLKPGKTWNTSIELNTRGEKTKQDVTFKVVGVEKLKTKVAVRDGLLIKGDGTAEMGGKKSKMTIKSWYTKGVGMIKMEITSKDASGKEKTITIQERKP